MKKAKRLLAVLLAAVMLFTAAYVPSYAAGDSWHNPTEGSDQKYFFSYQQGASWVLDMLDDLLGEMNIMLTCDELNDIANIGINLFTSNIMLDLDDAIDDYGTGIKGELDLRSVDNLIQSLAAVFDVLDGNWIVNFADALKLFGDLLNESYGLTDNGFNYNIRRSTAPDTEVLEMLISWISNLAPMLQRMLAGSFNWGSLLPSLFDGMVANLFPNLSSVSIENIPGLIADLLYTMLIDSSATAAPGDISNIDTWIQQLINWALVDGTGTDAASGGFSMLGMNAEPLLPAMGDETVAPGGASLSDISFYQLVNNVIQGFMGGTVKDLLSGLLYDLLGVEITEEFPLGDPAALQDETFTMIIGIVEGLLIANGAPEPTYTEEEKAYPVPYVGALLDWLLLEGGLDTFIKIEYEGISLTDNFMSLLNDVARLLINLLPSLGLFASSSHLAYTPDDLNVIWYLDADNNYVTSLEDTKVTQTYLTYETGEVIYPTAFETNADGGTTPIAYAYLADGTAVTLKDDAGNGDVDAALVRPNYVISTDMVYANIIKLALNDFIDGCYFPEWTTDIPSVLAYGFAALAAPVVPENNYYERLDAYHAFLEGAIAPIDDVITVNGKEIEILRYSILKSIPIKDTNGNVVATHNVEIPKAALDIICSFAADRLNGVFQLNNKFFTTDTTLEQFAGELLGWGFSTYLPIWVGDEDTTTGLFGANGKTGVFTEAFNTWANACYDNYAKRQVKTNANWDAIYELIDNTLFKLLPSSWLPGLSGSSQIINEWLLGNLIQFDLQGILGLLSINSDPNGELHLPTKKVLINIIDRVLAIIFNDNGVLWSSGSRSNVVTGNNVTTATTFGEILSLSSTESGLPILLYRLLTYLNTYKTPLFSTILPLIMSTQYQRPYDEEYLTASGRTEVYYKVADLENYLSSLTTNINAYEVRTFDVEEDAYAAVDGNAQAIKNADGINTDVVLSNGSVYGTYASRDEAISVINMLKDAYIYEETIEPTVEGAEPTTVYHLYANISYLESATRTPVSDATGDHAEYGDFRFAQATYRSASDPFVRYDDDYKYFTFEDFSTAGYVYNNYNQFTEEADAYISTYKDFATGDLVSAYGDWYMFWIESELKRMSCLDTNGDGRYLTADTTETITNADGTTTDVTYYADGDPGVPEAMYPYYTTASNSFNYFDNSRTGTAENRHVSGWHDSVTGEQITGINSDYFTTGNFEQLAMAAEYGSKAANNVALSTEETEAMVRYILASSGKTDAINFDITYNADGAFNGAYQWANLPDGYLDIITGWLEENGWTYEETTIIDGSIGYTLKRPAFKFFNAGSISFNGVTGDPELNSATVAGYIRKDVAGGQTYAEEVIIAISQGYYDYVETVYANRRALYNHMDQVSYRIENAENSRASVVDTTMLKWILDLSANDYKDNDTKRLNIIYSKDENGEVIFDENGNKIETKAFTTTSYAAFREAYDFAQSLYLKTGDANVLASGITQSMVTKAYEGLLKAWQQLVEFTGFADWVRIDAFQAIAEEILNDPYIDHETFGIESGVENLQQALADAKLYTDNKSNYDSESQDEIESAAGALNQAIQNLVYKTNPGINTDPEADDAALIKPTTYENQIQYAHIYGLEEGAGFGIYDEGQAIEALEALGLKISGITIDGSNGTVTKTNSARGSGTNARFDGRYRGNLRFRYFAVLYGDINGDTRIDGTDAAALNLYIENNEATMAKMGEAKFEAADVTHDQAVDGEDVQAIINHYTLVEDISQTVHSTDA